MSTPKLNSVTGCAFALLAVLLIPSIGSGASLKDDYRVTKWETEDGLPEDSATAMVQLPDGFIWFGTFNGLVRFDGLDFKVFTPENTPALPDRSIINLHRTDDDRMWISTGRGLASLQDGIWRRHGRDTAWTNRIVRVFASNAQGDLFATSFDGHICELKGDDVIPLPAPVTSPRRGYHATVDPDGTLWAYRRDYFGSWDGKAWNAVMTDAVTNQFQVAAPSRDGNTWVLTTRHLLKLESGKITRRIALHQDVFDIWSMYEDVDGTLWAPSHARGLFRLSQAGEVDRFTVRDGLSFNSLRFVKRGREKNLWIGTSGGGLMRLRPRVFRTYETESTLPNRIVKSVVEMETNRMLLGTFGGGVAQLQLAGNQAEVKQMPDVPTYVQSVLRDRAGGIWVGTHDATLFRDSPAGRDRFEIRGVKSLFEDSAGRIWIGGEEAVHRFESGAMTRMASSRPIGHAKAIAEHPIDKNVWVAGPSGLFRQAEDMFEEVRRENGLSVTNVCTLYFESDGTLWAGTINQGLLRRKTGEWSEIGVEDGLPSAKVAGLVEDGDGDLWIATDRGIGRSALSALHLMADDQSGRLPIEVFTRRDGLASGECSSDYQPTCVRDSAGRLWFGTIKGVAMVDPAQLEPAEISPPLRIEAGGFVDQQGVHHSFDVGSTEQVRIPPGSTQVTFDYTVPNYTAPEQVVFRHRVTRGDELIHQDHTSARFASFTGLRPGDYRLELQVANHHGIWHPDVRVIVFSVLPFYWQTLWFRGGAIALALAIIGGVIWQIRSFELSIARRQLNAERRMAMQLRENEERLRLAMDVAQIETWGWELKTGNMVSSPGLSRMFGGPEVESLGRKTEFEAFIHEDDRERVRKTIDQTIVDRGEFHQEFRVIWKDGSEHWIEARGEVFLSEEGKPDHIVGIAGDITQRRNEEVGRRKLETQYRETQRLESLGVLAGGIAHDFNNLLTSVLGNVGLLQMEIDNDHDHQELLRDVEKASRHAAELCGQMLAYSGKGSFCVRPVDLRQLVEDMESLLRHSINKNVELVVESATDSPLVTADESQLKQIILNLVINASEAIGDGKGIITIRTIPINVGDGHSSGIEPGVNLKPGQYAAIEVADNGEGMPADRLEKIFEPFFTSKFTGRGLGLSAVHGIIRGHKGGIEVKTEPGRGTEFTILLPAGESELETEDSPSATTDDPPTSLDGVALVVDDEERVRVTAERILAWGGMSVITANNGDQAVEMFPALADRLKIVLLDLTMPGRDGVETCRELKAVNPDVPIVMMSGYSEEEADQRLDGLPLAGFVKKPFQPVELIERLQAVLKNGHSSDNGTSQGIRK